jgi:alkanesulfonate monooxygenase SsuD/methylene tetrahydromethanopterin reductase-like flavin-dependent oxidoreductase (luciferase family)
MGDSDARPGLTDAWTTLAGLARKTSRIRLGTLVSAATLRLPGPLAVTVAQVDQMTSGRVELGLDVTDLDHLELIARQVVPQL